MLFGIAAMLQLSGCAICTQMPPQYKKTIHTVKINKKVPVPQKMSYVSTKTQMASVLSPIAAMAVANAVDVPQEANLRHFAANNNIKIDQIVLQQFMSQISQKTGYRIVDQGPADAELDINVTDYGFQSPGEFSNGHLKPDLRVEISLVRNGKPIWISRDFTTNLTKGMPSYTYEQLTQNPNCMTTAWNTAAERLVSEIVSHM